MLVSLWEGRVPRRPRKHLPVLYSLAPDPLSFTTSSNNESTWTAGGTVTVPAQTACATTLTPPTIFPLGFSSLGPVVVTLSTTAPGAATYYQLTGAGYSPSALYTGPFIINQPGSTTVLAYSSRAGAVSSQTVVATFIISYCVSRNVSSVGIATIPSSKEGGGRGRGACVLWRVVSIQLC